MLATRQWVSPECLPQQQIQGPILAQPELQAVPQGGQGSRGLWGLAPSQKRQQVGTVVLGGHHRPEAQPPSRLASERTASVLQPLRFLDRPHVQCLAARMPLMFIQPSCLIMQR